MDGMTVTDLGAWLKAHREELVASLLDGSYRLQEVSEGWRSRRPAAEG